MKSSFTLVLPLEKPTNNDMMVVVELLMPEVNYWLLTGSCTFPSFLSGRKMIQRTCWLSPSPPIILVHATRGWSAGWRNLPGTLVPSFASQPLETVHAARPPCFRPTKTVSTNKSSSSRDCSYQLPVNNNEREYFCFLFLFFIYFHLYFHSTSPPLIFFPAVWNNFIEAGRVWQVICNQV